MRSLLRVSLSAFLFCAACGGGEDGASPLVVPSPEPPGDNCEYGGQRLDVGLDANGDGVLDPDDIDSTSYVCNGADQDSSLVDISVEPPGDNCAAGGQRVDIGHDANGDGTLDADEIDATQYVCDGIGASVTLVTATAEEAGTNCPNGGQRIDVGIDDDEDGTLDPEEIDSTEYVCDGDDGLRSLVLTTPETAGTNCASGGQRIDVGIDDDEDGTLDPEEIDSTSYVCDGESALVTLVTTTAEPPGTNCTAGGQRIDLGVDDSDDGVLDPTEIDSTSYLCNGVGALATLVDVVAEPPGLNCSSGGQRIDVGVDDNDDGVLDSGEVDTTTYVCNGDDGLRSLILITEEMPSTNCAGGGQRIDVGIDDDDDGTLDSTEIDQTAYVCNPPQSARYLYLANWAAFSTDFDVYDIAANSWSPGAVLPVPSRGQLASDGSSVWMLGTDNNVYEYDVEADSWTLGMAGPGGISSFAFFQWLDGNFYVCQASTSTLHVYSGGAWSTVALSADCSIAGGTDPFRNEVYVKTFGQAGFSVIDATTNSVVRTITDTTSIAENTSSGAFLGNRFYTRSSGGNIYALSGTDGTRTNTGDDPGGSYPGFTADHFADVIYIHSSSGFSIYDPVAGTFTPLTTGPTQSTVGTITLTS